MPSSDSPQDVYARLMICRDPSRGYPLWFPEPDSSLPEDYRHEGLRIGDVGIVVEDGSFDVLFNICLPEDHPLHQPHGVPANFKRVVLLDRDLRKYPFADRVGEVISTWSVSHRDITADASGGTSTVVPAGLGFNFQFSSSSAEGAILVLPEDAGKADLANLGTFRTEALRNAESWYHFAYVNLGRADINNDSLCLITGYHKASSWSIAAFSDAGSDASLTATFTAGEVFNGNITGAYSWQVANSLDWRVGPEEGHNRNNRNQAVSIRSYKIALREGLFASLLGRVKVSSGLPRTKSNASRPYLPRVVPSGSASQSSVDLQHRSLQGALERSSEPLPFSCETEPHDISPVPLGVPHVRSTESDGKSKP
ncbi:hypothetical protein BS17DRAFT_744996 [Gyrodon lividus]|nr:hypothetical protein BS17DRAFT_744996 [Gyrodon lividus]